MGHLLRIWWSGSKDLLSQFSWAKRGGTRSRPFSERWILWKSSVLTRFIFVVPEYGNLTGVKTHRDRLEEGILERGVQTFGFGEGKRPHRGFRCCSVIALSLFCLLRPWNFRNFFFCSRLPFRVFTLESFFFPFLFFLIHFFYCPIMHLTIQNSFRTSERLIKIFLLAEEKRQQPCWLWKISQGRKLFSPSIHVQSKWTF